MRVKRIRNGLCTKFMMYEGVLGWIRDGSDATLFSAPYAFTVCFLLT